MINRRGWVVVAGSVALAVAGRILGVLELFVLATGGVALVLLAVGLVAGRRSTVEARRVVSPSRLHAGTDARVELRVRNPGKHRSAVTTLRDSFDNGRRQARLLLPPIDAGSEERASYRLPTDRRGIFTIGPLEAMRSDPFRLASAQSVIAAATEIVVYPRIHPIAPLPRTLGQDPNASADHATAVGSAGEDFYGLRNYEMGDDLRRVHWPSTAHIGELMIRQHEMPWQGRVTVLVDLRAAVHNDDSLEAAISAAASVVVACWQHGWFVRLVTSGGFDSGFASGHDQLEAILYQLAVAQAGAGQDLDAVVRALHRSGTTGALTVISTGGVAGTDLERLARLRARFGSLTAVVFNLSSRRLGEDDPGLVASGAGAAAGGRSLRHMRWITLIEVDSPDRFALSWNRAVVGHGPSDIRQPRRAMRSKRVRR